MSPKSLLPTPAPPLPEDESARLLRGVSRLLPTGVAVLTAVDQGMVHGATVSTAGVLSQRPLRLGVSLRNGSLMTRIIERSGWFAVNVLSSRQALLADWFANPQRPSGTEQFELIRTRLDDGTGIPLLQDALAHFVCRLSDQLPLGSSDDLLVAEIDHARAGAGRPLINFGGELHDVEFHGVRRRQGWRADATTTLE
ncbi:flavin reductase family protein [Streptomyces puniciscabiei]|uniref:flavin reductase family protein n=1 Tax=Streptomyces puniciscabiei TaxID=164348 RepID=UPI0037AE32EC